MSGFKRLGRSLFRDEQGTGGRARTFYAVAAFVVMLAVIAAVFWYIFTDPNTDSDYVENVIWAQASIDSGRIMSDTFNYGYSMPFGGNLFMLPFVAALGPTLMANRLGIALFFTLVLFALMVLAKNASERKGDVYFLVTAALLAMFTYCGNNLLHHILFYGMAYLSSLGMLGCAIPLITGRAEGKKSIKWYAGLLIWGFIGAANGTVGLALSALPAAGAVIWSVFIKREKLLSRGNRKEGLIVALLAAASVLGLIYYSLAMAGVPETDYVAGTGTFTLGSTADVLERLAALPSAWMHNFVFAENNASLMSLAGLLGLFRALIMATVTVAPIVMAALWKKLDRISKLLLMYHILVSAVCIAESVLTLRDPGLSRLLFNMLLSSFFITGVFLTRCIGRVRFKNAAIVLMAGAVLFISTDVYKYGKYSETSPVVTTLENEGLKYGFSTFWNANVNTVKSGGKLKMTSIGIQNTEGITTLSLQTDSKWYEKPADAQEFFLLLDEKGAEYARIQNTNRYLIESAKREVELGGYRVLVYDIGFWDQLFKPEIKVCGPNYGGTVAERGCEKTAAEDGYIIESSGLLYQQANTDAGQYRISVSGDGMEKAKLSVYNGECVTEIAQEEKQISGNTVSFVFDLAEHCSDFKVMLENDAAEALLWRETVMEKVYLESMSYDISHVGILTEGECEFADTEIAFWPGSSVHAPYCDLHSGAYRVTVYGVGLENTEIRASLNCGEQELEVSDIEYAEESISFTVEVPFSGSGFETVLTNTSENYILWRSMTIDSIA